MMNAATEFDLGPLTWVKGEIDLALQRAEEALEKYQASADRTQLKFCRTHIHQVHGALAIVGLDGTTLLTESLEALLGDMEADRNSAGDQGVQAVAQALAALRRYLDELMAGEPNQALRLLPACQSLASARGIDSPHPGDLFYPDLSLRPPKRAASKQTAEERIAALKQERTRFQKGLLSWLKKPAEAEQGRRLMRDALQVIEALPHSPVERSFWWVALALLEALADGSVAADPYARQLCSRIDAQIRSTLEGKAAPQERLLREALYYVALASGDIHPAVAQAQELYSLKALIPQAVTELPQPQDAALRKLREVLGLAEEQWNKFCNGNQSSLAAFVDSGRQSGQLIAQIPHTDLKRLGQGFVAIANWLAEDAKRFNDSVAMEVATAILLLENAQENFKRLGADFAQQVDLMVARLHAKIAGKVLGNDDIPLLDEMTRRAQERLLIGQVGKEIQRNLAQIEQALDTFFREPARMQDLAQLDGPFKQIGGALAMLGHFSAVATVKECSDRIKEFAKPGYQPNQVDFESVANQLSLLGFFVDALANGESDFDAFVRRINGEPEVVDAPEEDAYQEPVVAIAEPESKPLTESVQVVPELVLDIASDLPDSLAIPDQPIVELVSEVLPVQDVEPAALQPAPAAAMAPAPIASASQAVAPEHEEIDAELLAIFLEEAREVLETIGEQKVLLQTNPANLDALTTIRRSTHTLKGSGRMVGLTALGEAAWELEQTFNLWLRQDQLATPELIQIVADEHDLFLQWVDFLESGAGHIPNPAELVAAAKRLRGVEPEEAIVAVAAPSQAPVVEQMPVVLEALEVEIPAVEIPAVEIPAVEIPAVEIPAVEIPAVEIPAVEIPAVEIPAVEIPAVEIPAVEADGISASPLASSFDAIETGLVTQPLLEAAEAALSFEDLPAEPASDALQVESFDLDSAAFDLQLDDIGLSEVELTEASAHHGETQIGFEDSLDSIQVSEAFAAQTAVADDETTLTEDSLLASEVDEGQELALDQLAATPQVATAEVITLDFGKAPEPEPLAPAAPTLYDIFREEASGYLRTLVNAHAVLDAHPQTPTSFEMTRAAHTLGGISGTVGLMPLHHLAIALEHALLRRDASGQPDSIEGLETVRRTIMTLQDMFDSLSRQLAPEDQPELIAALEDIFQPLGRQEDITLEVLPPSELLGIAEDAVPLSEPRDAEEIAAEPTAEIEAVIQPLELAESSEPAVASLQEVAEVAPAPIVPMLKDEFDEQLLPIFLEEAGDLLRDLTAQLRAWRGDPTDQSVAHAIGRLLHTFKGSSRMAGAMNLGELTHLLETRVEDAMKAGSANGALVDDIENGCDLLVHAVDRLKDGDFSPMAPVLPVAVVEGQEAAQEAAAPVVSATVAAVAANVAASEADTEQEITQQRATLRVRADLIDRLVNEAGELSIARTRIEGEMRGLKNSLLFLTENVIRLRNQLREIEIQAESQIQARVAQSSETEVDFDPLELDRFTRFQELTRFMAESVNDVATVQQNLLKNLDDANAAILAQARLNRSLQQELMGMRMVPFAMHAERLYRIVRQTAKDVGKRANLEIVGGQVDIDRSVLDKMMAPIEHMLRNAVTHGIEKKDERVAAGKSDVGEITLQLTQEGNEFILSMSDDGKGLNAERIRTRAEAMGLLQPGQPVDDTTLFGFIFHPGFSTATELTQVSGRGIGMDVVKTEVTALGGRIEILSSPGLGSTFRLYLPLTLAVTQTLLVRVGGQEYALPSTMIEQVLEMKERTLTAIREQGSVEWQGHRYPFHFLPHLLGDHYAAPEAHRQYWVLLLRSGTQRTAVLVDELKGNQEVVVKNIGAQLARVVGIAGATVLGDGSVVLILNPVALASRAAVAAIDVQQPIVPVPQEAVKPNAAEVYQPTVMVVDDSLTVRKITSRLLNREGYTVLLAKDGVDALEQLIDARPDVILSDIEMPRMDGFDFVRNVRGDVNLRDIPVIMITSRTADKHRNYALEIGASHYLGKPYDEDELLGLIGAYCKRN